MSKLEDAAKGLIADFGTAADPKEPDAVRQRELDGTAPSDEVLSQEQIDRVGKQLEVQKKFENRGLEAAGLGTLSGGSLGLSDQLLVKLGIYTQDELRNLYAENPGATLGGEVVGTLAPALFSGGTSLAAKGVTTVGKGAATAFKAGQATERITAKALSQIIKDTGKQKFAKDVIKKAVPLAAGSSVEAGLFATGQLVKEDALGTAEFNAENLITNFGAGALIGGTLGAGFGVALPLLGKSAGVAGKAVKSKIDEYTEEVSAAAEFFGISTPKQAKLAIRDKKFLDDLPRLLREDYDLANKKNASEVLEEMLKKESAAQIRKPEILDQLEDLATKNPTFQGSKDEILDTALNFLDEAREKLKGAVSSGDKSMLRSLNNYRYKLNLLKFDETPFTPKVLRNLEDEAARMAKYNKLEGASLENVAARNVKALFKESIDDVATRIKNAGGEGAALADELLTVNRHMHSAIRLKEGLQKKVLKGDNFFNLQDTILSGVAYTGIGPASIAAIGAKKFLQSDIRRRMVVLAKMEEVNQKVTAYVDKSMKSIIKGGAKPASAFGKTAQATLVKSVLARKRKPDGKESKPSSEQEAFRNIRDNVLELKSNPDKLEKRAVSSVSGLSTVAPNTATASQALLLRAVDFLLDKLPKDQQTRVSAFNRPQQLSDLEMSKFKRYISALEAPLSVVEDLMDGTATREQVQAVKAVFPDLYTRMQGKALEYIAEAEEPVPYNKRIMLGNLLDIPTDSSLRPDAFANLQENFGIAADRKEQEMAENRKRTAQGLRPGSLPITGLNKMTIAERENSAAQAFTRRRQS